MASMFEGSIVVGAHVLNLRAVAQFSRIDHHASGKITMVELVSGSKLEFFGHDGDRLWAFAMAGATKMAEEDEAAHSNV